MIFQTFNLVTRTTVMNNVLTGRLGEMSPFRGFFSLWSEDDKKIAKLNSPTWPVTQKGANFPLFTTWTRPRRIEAITFLALQAIFFSGPPRQQRCNVAGPKARWPLFSALSRFSFKRNWDARKSA